MYFIYTYHKLLYYSGTLKCNDSLNVNRTDNDTRL